MKQSTAVGSGNAREAGKREGHVSMMSLSVLRALRDSPEDPSTESVALLVDEHSDEVMQPEQDKHHQYDRLNVRRIAPVQELGDIVDAEGNAITRNLPDGQYEVELRPRYLKRTDNFSTNGSSPEIQTPQRRAVFSKSVMATASRNGISRTRSDASEMSEADYDDEHDNISIRDCAVEDLSLGMKLTILEGFVIVQEISPLSDGRASPAQLNGCISRGDILVAIGDKTICGMPFMQLSGYLKKLSFDQSTRSKQKLLLRFKVSEGLRLLEKHFNSKNEHDGKRILAMEESEGDALVDMFMPSQLTLVDQFTGMPLFNDSLVKEKQAPKLKAAPKEVSVAHKVIDKDEAENSSKDVSNVEGDNLHSMIAPISINDRLDEIARRVLNTVKENYSDGSWRSGFYDLDERLNFLLRHRPSLPDCIDDGKEKKPTLSQRVIIGEEAVAGASALLTSVEAAHRAILQRSSSLISFEASEHEIIPFESVISHNDDEIVENLFSSYLQMLEAEGFDGSEKKHEGIFSIVFHDRANALPAVESTSVLSNILRLSRTQDIANDFPEILNFASDLLINVSKDKLREMLVLKALPIWFKTFIPLPLSERKLIWPLDTVVTNLLEDSVAEVILREQCCDLITFYLEQIIESSSSEEVIDFIAKYGSYLNLNSSISVSMGSLKAKLVIPKLVEVAKHDPLCQSAVDYKYKGEILLLSVLMNLDEIVRKDEDTSILVRLYPDLQPWQVEIAAGGKESPYYYKYICLLLDIKNGNYAARMNSDIVATYCILSSKTSSGISNLEKVILDENGMYARDLLLLMELSVAVKRDDLVITVCEKVAPEQVEVGPIFDNLRKILRRRFMQKLNGKNGSVDVIRRVLSCWKLLQSYHNTLNNCESLSNELFYIFQHLDSNNELTVKQFLDVASNEFPPQSFIDCLGRIDFILLSTEKSIIEGVLEALQTVTKQAVVDDRLNFSHFLMKVQRFRHRNRSITVEIREDKEVRKNLCRGSDIWNSIGDGTIHINK